MRWAKQAAEAIKGFFNKSKDFVTKKAPVVAEKLESQEVKEAIAEAKDEVVEEPSMTMRTFMTNWNGKILSEGEFTKMIEDTIDFYKTIGGNYVGLSYITPGDLLKGGEFDTGFSLKVKQPSPEQIKVIKASNPSLDKDPTTVSNVLFGGRLIYQYSYTVKGKDGSEKSKLSIPGIYRPEKVDGAKITLKTFNVEALTKFVNEVAHVTKIMETYKDTVSKLPAELDKLESALKSVESDVSVSEIAKVCRYTITSTNKILNDFSKDAVDAIRLADELIAKSLASTKDQVKAAKANKK